MADQQANPEISPETAVHLWEEWKLQQSKKLKRTVLGFECVPVDGEMTMIINVTSLDIALSELSFAVGGWRGYKVMFVKKRDQTH